MTDDDVETKHELLLALLSGSDQTEVESLPSRPLTHAEVAELETAYAAKADSSEAWIIDMAGDGQTTAALQEQEYGDDQTVLTFALLVDGSWIPFEFGDGRWYRSESLPHPEGVDLDEELSLGSMVRVATLLD